MGLIKNNIRRYLFCVWCGQTMVIGGRKKRTRIDPTRLTCSRKCAKGYMLFKRAYASKTRGGWKYERVRY